MVTYQLHYAKGIARLLKQLWNTVQSCQHEINGVRFITVITNFFLTAANHGFIRYMRVEFSYSI